MPQRSSSEQVPWYGQGLRFGCLRCGNCCTGKPGYVWVNDAEIDAISRYLGMTRNEFRTKYLTLTHMGYTIVEKAGYDCALLENHACRAYPVRPRQCRTWPFWRDNLKSREAWEEGARNCPGMGKGRLYTPTDIEAIARGEKDT